MSCVKLVRSALNLSAVRTKNAKSSKYGQCFCIFNRSSLFFIVCSTRRSTYCCRSVLCTIVDASQPYWTLTERLQALNGPWPDLVRSLTERITRTSQGFTDWNTERGRDFQSLSAVVFVAEQYPKGSTWPRPTVLERMLLRTEPIPTRLRKGLYETASGLVLLAASPAGACLRKPARLSPVEFVMAAVLVYVHREALGITRMGKAITQLRSHLRKQFEGELKCNSHVMRCALAYIKKLGLEGLGGDGLGDVPITKLLARKESGEPRSQVAAADAVGASAKVLPSTAKHPLAKPKSNTKRKHPASDSSNDSDDDDKPLVLGLSRRKRAVQQVSSVPSGIKTSSHPSKSNAAPEPKVSISSSVSAARATSDIVIYPMKYQTPAPAAQRKRKRATEVSLESDADSEDDVDQPMRPPPRKRTAKPAASAAIGFQTSSLSTRIVPSASKTVSPSGTSKSTTLPSMRFSKKTTSSTLPPKTGHSPSGMCTPAAPLLLQAGTEAQSLSGATTIPSATVGSATPLAPAAASSSTPARGSPSSPVSYQSKAPALALVGKTLDPRSRPPPLSTPATPITHWNSDPRANDTRPSPDHGLAATPYLFSEAQIPPSWPLQQPCFWYPYTQAPPGIPWPGNELWASMIRLAGSQSLVPVPPVGLVDSDLSPSCSSQKQQQVARFSILEIGRAFVDDVNPLGLHLCDTTGTVADEQHTRLCWHPSCSTGSPITRMPMIAPQLGLRRCEGHATRRNNEGSNGGGGERLSIDTFCLRVSRLRAHLQRLSVVLKASVIHFTQCTFLRRRLFLRICQFP